MIYKLKPLDFVLEHWNQVSVRLGELDQDDHPLKNSPDKSGLDAQVASGDFFVTMATRLDQVSQSLSRNQHSDYILLEKAISDLLYLHQNYQISKK